MVIRIINVNSITVHKPKDHSVVSGDSHRLAPSIFTLQLVKPIPQQVSRLWLFRRLQVGKNTPDLPHLVSREEPCFPVLIELP